MASVSMLKGRRPPETTGQPAGRGLLVFGAGWSRSAGGWKCIPKKAREPGSYLPCPCGKWCSQSMGTANHERKSLSHGLRRVIRTNDNTGCADCVMNRRVRIKVSIVEDDSKARELLVDWINRADRFQCVSNHPSGEDALENMPAHGPQVVLMDINLTGMNGPECVRRLKPLLPGTQFLMLTVYEDSDHIIQALQSGATGYLLKH